jgi:hypothetical protein
VRDKEGKVVLLSATTVDDILIAGTAKARQKIKDVLKTRFKITELGPLQKHLGVYYTLKRDNLGAPYYEMRLPHMTESVVQQYEKSEYGSKHPLKEENVPATANLSREMTSELLIRRRSDHLLGRLCMQLERYHQV